MSRVMELPYEMARRSLNIQTTLTERLGLPVRIIVNHDLILLPYQPMVSNQGGYLKHHAQAAAGTFAQDREHQTDLRVPGEPQGRP